ncbi:hypothetical protein [Anaeromicropila herbilytica]|uniref:Uncharacterized protein n=1 Tax=Anaeromicropila herbilytica TaxID=2785025 RepID=A0A7R7IC51_9FIRM|nr:hypothetical protein [Anaeromicropila herbilytica]BCN29539.1 hypothetical protein bsdtb5_08340 [Anaeromicropila herbilytica]
MNKIYKYFIIIGVIMLYIINSNVVVKADPNMDGGGKGGGTQQGSGSNFYSTGDDGVRITIVDMKTKRRAEGTISIDYYRKPGKTQTAVFHFGKVCKLEYMGVGGYPTQADLKQSSDDYNKNENGQYTAFNVDDMPTIVSNSSSNSSIEKIKNYFNDSTRLELIAKRVGINYNQLISGNYKIIIEPMIYITFETRYIAMTAHEAAKLDMALGGTTTTGGKLRAKFVSFTHKNLPLSIFLKKKELGIKRWTGSKTERVNNGRILEYLGIGILSFKPDEVETDIEAGNYTYRPDTDVITAIDVSVGSEGDGATCDNPITVQFSGDMITTTQVTGITIPPNGSRLVWIKWHTPNLKTKTSTTIHALIVGGGTASSASVGIVISPIDEKEPPNPTADDHKPINWSDDILPTFPKTGALSKFSSPVSARSWHTYTCTKKSVWNGEYYTDAKGKYILDGSGNRIKIYETVYEFSTNHYSASLVDTNTKLKPDNTTKKSNITVSSVKSGYGIELNVASNIVGSSSDTTGIQTAVVYFPEFSYKKYRRIGKLPGAALNSTIQFPINQYSIYKNPVHFTPIWFPDKEYKVYIESLDAWTPAGMICDKATASIQVKGSLWDDWHIGVIPNLP